jgi:hypothetical protein
MHCHAAIVAGLVCSKFNHLTKGFESGSLTLEYFRNGNIKFFKETNTSVSGHLNQIISKQFNTPMVRTNFIYQHTFQNKKNPLKSGQQKSCVGTTIMSKTKQLHIIY